MFDLGRGLLASVARMPGAIAISDGPLTRNYGEWGVTVTRLAAGLIARGLEPGTHVVSLLTNRYEAATLHLACQLAGLVITPVNWRANSAELGHVLEDCAAGALFFEQVTHGAVAGCKSLPSVCLPVAGEEWTQMAASAAPLAASRAAVDTGSVMLYTSGTTGKGKGVPRSHGAERAAALAHVAQNQYGRGEVTLGVMPLYHTMGVRSLLASIIVNGHFVCQRRFDAREALHLIERHRISHLYLVPTLYHDLVNHADFAATDTRSVRKLGFAGQSMTDDLLRQLQQAFAPERFVNHYGSSEIYTFTVEPDAPAKPGSAGKAGLNQEIRVIAIDSTDPKALTRPGEEGQIIAALDGDEAFAGYWNRPDADAKSLHGGWYFTGDTGYLDDDGDLFVTGRVDDMITSGGENISPVEIESMLSLHPDVAEVAVAGLADERWGQAVCAFVTTHRPIAAEELDAWCLQSKLASFKRPRRYVFVKAIPKSPVGKIMRRELVAGNYQIQN
ncbi:MAG: AMP-binding protein [Gammaproteobacteria bacterium]|nr:AMP-binding protein [Gammaproteobacteria bacterium]